MKVRYTIVVDIDEEALLARNDAAGEMGSVELPTDPTEWGDSDLTLALSDDVASLKIEESDPA